MSLEIAAVFGIVALAAVLFVTERIRFDIVALMVLAVLAVTELVTPAEALSGFSNPAVVTVWAVFILSSGLARTGVAGIVGRQILRISGQGEVSLIAILMLTAGLMSAFMNNVGVAALLLPVTVEIARRTGRSPARLLIPMAFGALLGGLTTLIGTPGNILVSDAMRDAGFGEFAIFDFAPVGLLLLLTGTLYMLLIGRHLLPRRTSSEKLPRATIDLKEMYGLENMMCVLHVPSGSGLARSSLASSRIGKVLGLNVVGVLRKGDVQAAPPPDYALKEDDRLVVVGKRDLLEAMRRHELLTVESRPLDVDEASQMGIEYRRLEISQESPLVGKSLIGSSIRNRFHINVLAFSGDDGPTTKGLHDRELQAGDKMLVLGARSSMALLQESPEVILSESVPSDRNWLQGMLRMVAIPNGSALAGRSLLDSRLGEAFGLNVLRIIRDHQVIMVPEPEVELRGSDTLLVLGEERDVNILQSLAGLEVDDSAPAAQALETTEVGLAEAVISPHATLTGHTLNELHFRTKFGLNVVAIWRAGEALLNDLGEIRLRFGDALLLHGSMEKVKVLGSEPDFIVLATEAQERPRAEKAPIAVAIMAAVILAVMFGLLPISIAAVIGSVLMVLAGAMTMDEAYRRIEWKAVFLIAGMLPLGIALQNTGAATYLADRLVGLTEAFGPVATLAGLFILSTLATQVIPGAAVAVLMVPVALGAAGSIGGNPQAYAMIIAVASSATFMGPISHPANVLVMGPGGYRFADYFKVGLPLTIIVLAVALLAVPYFWPL